MQITLTELAGIIGGEISGDGSVIIRGVAGIKEARQGDITFLADPSYNKFLKTTEASAVIAARGSADTDKPLILIKNPYLAFAKAIEFFMPPEKTYPRTIHPAAVISPGALIGKDVGVGACAVIEDGAKIGDGSLVSAGSYVGQGTEIGEGCLIYPNVTIREDVRIGDRVIIHSGAVVGSDGFGFASDGEAHVKIPQVGSVTIEDDVEIGANVTIDRATMGATIVGKGTKIDNLVQIAHNVVIGENCMLVAQVGIGGSTELGKGVTLAGQAGAIDHIKIGDGAIAAAQAGITKSVPAETMVSGYPAREHSRAKKVYACVSRLPELVRKTADLAVRVAKLEAERKR